MDIAVIHESPRPTWSSRMLLSAIEEEGHRPRYLRISQVSAWIPGRVKYRGRCLRIDSGIIRSLGVIIGYEQFTRRVSTLRQMELEGIPLINPVDSMLLARDKYMSLVVLSKNGIPVPETLVTERIDEAVRAVEKWGAAVVKPIVGSMGRGSIKLDNPDVAYNVFKTLLSLGMPLYVQRFVEKKEASDVRVFVVGDEVIAAEKRFSPAGSWKTNIAQGGVAEAYEPSEEEAELAVKASRALGLEYAGVDLAETGDGLVVFEVNASPLWRGLAETTGVNPAKHIVRHLVALARR